MTRYFDFLAYYYKLSLILARIRFHENECNMYHALIVAILLYHRYYSYLVNLQAHCMGWKASLKSAIL